MERSPRALGAGWLQTICSILLPLQAGHEEEHELTTLRRPIA